MTDALLSALNGKPALTADPQFAAQGGSSSTGGTSIQRAVTVKAAENGSVTADVSTAKAGDAVSITVTPNAGFAVASVKVFDANGREIEVVKGENGVYTFQMPTSGVTIETEFVKDSGFVDVYDSDYYYEAVNWAAARGITTGVSETEFDPQGACTRAQTVTFLWRAFGSPEPTAANPFTDVDESAYYCKAVLWAVENGITKGTSDTTFSPNDTVTRAQTVTFLFRSAKGAAAGTANPFTDVDEGAYYYEAVLWAVENGITKGTSDAAFSPDSGCTRAQIVTFLYRYLA